MFDKINRPSGVTGVEIGFNNLMPISSPVTLGEPKTSFGRMIRDAIVPPPPQNEPEETQLLLPKHDGDRPTGSHQEYWER